jgi:tetratricopeptide (TPR) repeat protein
MHGRPIFLWLAIISMWFALVLGQMSECRQSSICAVPPQSIDISSDDCAVPSTVQRGVRPHATPASSLELRSLYDFNISGRFQEAESSARRLLADHYHDPKVHLHLAYAHRGAGDHAGAIAAYGDALKLSVGHNESAMRVRIDAMTGLVASYLDAGELEQAQEVYVRAAQIARRQESIQKSHVSAYQLACIFAQGVRVKQLTGSTLADDLKTQSLRFLGVALERGEVSDRHLAADLDLAPVRDLAAFRVLVGAKD